MPSHHVAKVPDDSDWPKGSWYIDPPRGPCRRTVTTMMTCIADADCDTTNNCVGGFCRRGNLGDRCTHYSPQPCSTGLTCSSLGRCVTNEDFELEGKYCFGLQDCSIDMYCLKDEGTLDYSVGGICVEQKGHGETCELDSECKDGHSCHEGTCVKRCWVDANDDGTCHKYGKSCMALSPETYGLCIGDQIKTPPKIPVVKIKYDHKVTSPMRVPFDDSRRYGEGRSSKRTVSFEASVIIFFALLVVLIAKLILRRTSKKASPAPSTPIYYPTLPPSPIVTTQAEYPGYSASYPRQAEAPPMYTSAYPGCQSPVFASQQPFNEKA